MKKGILLAVVILLLTAGFTRAQEGELTGTIDATYHSSYIWRGFDYYADDHSAVDTSVNVDLYGTGYGLKVLYRKAISGGYENAQNLDVTLHYSDGLYQGETYATNYTVGWVYYGFPDEPRSGSTHAAAQAADMQELFAALSWPDIWPAGFVPSYTVLTMWPSEGNSQARKNTGWAHVLGLGYDLTISGLTPDVPEQTLNFSAALVYNDGVAPGVVTAASGAGGTIDHDWSHALVGVTTSFDLGNDLTLTPAVYHQLSMEDTINKEDQTWVTLSVKHKF